MATTSWGDVGKNLLGSAVNFGLSMIGKHQDNQAAKGAANEAALAAQRQAEFNAQEAAILDKKMELLKQPTASAASGGNTGLYIGLGVGGLVLTGLVVFLIVRKKA